MTKVRTPASTYQGDLLRAHPGGLELRDDTPGATPTMFGYFSTFNAWYQIESAHEGTFLERVDPYALDDTISRDRYSIKVLFDHGFDPQIGNKPLGPIAELRADTKGAYYEVPLLDTDYNRDFIVPALRGTLMDGREVGSQLGASFRFQVTDESWEYPKARSTWNPGRLPERTIRGAKVFEFGPVTFPASPTATSGVRSLTDDWITHLNHDPLFVARLSDRCGADAVLTMLRSSERVAQLGRRRKRLVGHGRSKSHRAALLWATLNPRRELQ
jgi:phage head maturation protease